MLAQRSTVLLAAGSLLAGSLALGGVAFGAAAPFKLTSTTFRDGTMMPVKIANKNQPGAQPNPNCVGENISPELSWSGAPAGTKSFALSAYTSSMNSRDMPPVCNVCKPSNRPIP